MINRDLNDPITIDEKKGAIQALKLGKSVGIDNLPNEILKKEKLITILNELFNLCFLNAIIPELWSKSIIVPILKPGKDYRDPYGYRSISLMSTVAKLFSTILNKRIVSYLEQHNILHEEQNGFRKFRSCLDHIYTLCTILRNRKTQKLDTFLCYVDFSKAF